MGRLGLVAARGRVMVHHHGFRAEEMVPLALVISDDEGQPMTDGPTRQRQAHEEHRRRLQRLSQRYSIPLSDEYTLDWYIALHGQLIHYADLPAQPGEPAERPGRLKRLFGRLPATG